MPVSRSNPNEGVRNPSTRWFEWAGGKDGGFVRYYDKEKKENVVLELPFVFILLDELSTVRGWHDPSDSGIYCNEVRDTRQDTLVVKSFKGGELASGLYAQIRDRVKAIGGHFQSSTYITFKSDDKNLALGNLAFKGAALNAWVEFKNAHRSDVYKQAVSIFGYTDARKGSTDYRIPKFALKPIAPETDTAAIEIDRELQAYLTGYLNKSRDDQAATTATTREDPTPVGQETMLERMAKAEADRLASQEVEEADFVDDDIPF